MANMIAYRHHDILIMVEEDLKGRHREHCLCYRCTRFNPRDPLNNCPIAQRLFELEIELHIVAPVWECPDAIDGEPQSTAEPEFPVEKPKPKAVTEE